jgi:hypothetical protein
VQRSMRYEKKSRNLWWLRSLIAGKNYKVPDELYERIVTKINNNKLALIVVVHKLLNQCFAISRSGRPYKEMYLRVLTK